MTDQQQADYDLISDLWHLLREYGDLTNDHMQLDRWEEYTNKSEELRKRHPEARILFVDLDNMLERRSVQKNQGELKIAC